MRFSLIDMRFQRSVCIHLPYVLANVEVSHGVSAAYGVVNTDWFYWLSLWIVVGHTSHMVSLEKSIEFSK